MGLVTIWLLFDNERSLVIMVAMVVVVMMMPVMMGSSERADR